MKITTKPFLLSLLVIALSACTSTDNTVSTAQSTDNSDAACPAYTFNPPAGLKALPNEALPERAKMPPTKGGVCAGMVYEVTEPVTVYRVYSADKSNSLYGGWWAFTVPQGPRDAYRKKYNICPSWSELNLMSHCTVKVGTKITVGPGQSAYCKTIDETLPASSGIQVYIPNWYEGGQVYVENCSKGTVWP